MPLARSLVSLTLLASTVWLQPAHAADRMRAGQWVGTTTVGSRVFPNSSCISQADADAMNGDAKAVQALLEKSIPPSICKISDLRASGGQVVYVATCGSQPPRTVTTTYRGDSSQGSDSIGTKTEAKLTGACK